MDRRTDGGDYNIPFTFFLRKRHGDKNHFNISTKEEQLYVQDMASLSRHSITCSAKDVAYCI